MLKLSCHLAFPNHTKKIIFVRERAMLLIYSLLKYPGSEKVGLHFLIWFYVKMSCEGGHLRFLITKT